MTPLDHAITYARMGWPVLPLHSLRNGRCTCGKANCPSPGKHPLSDLVPHGVHDASKDEARIAEWWARVPAANVGVATGEPSGFDVLDVDPRNGGDDTLADMELKHGKLPDTALQLTGGGGYHYLLTHNPDHRLRSPGRGVDVKSTGGYIVVEPSTHASGGHYAWEGSADPTDGHLIAVAPDWLKQTALAQRAVNNAHAGIGSIGPERISDLRAALGHLDASAYATWIGVGQALHSTEAPEAFEIWDTWSQGAANYDHSTVAKWSTFNAGGALHVESIFAWARDAGWDGTAQRVPIPEDGINPFQALAAIDATPSPLLRLPGALGTFVDLYNRTAPKPQPQFAVQAALAFGATVLGRRYKSTASNWPSLYFVNVAKSAAGKEHARTVIDAVLSAAQLPQLIGPSGYTSDSAVFSTLHHQPSHLTVIDELGDLLGNAKAQGNFHKRQAMTSLVQVWGLLDGTFRPPGYSTMALRPDQRAEALARCVHRPALTLMGMTTPRTFYESLTEQSIEGGFLNRLLVVESSIGRQMSRDADPLNVPDSLIEWCHAVRAGQDGNLTGLDLAADMVPLPRVVDFMPAARAVLRAYEAECMVSQDALEAEGLAELEGRSREKAMRLALILAVADNPATPFIREEHAEWAVQYVRHYTAQTITAVRRHMHGSQFGQWRAAILEVIQAAGAKGRTERDLGKFSRTYRSLDTRQRKSVLDVLKGDGEIEFVSSKSSTGRGRPRHAWVALAPGEDDDD